MPGLGFNCSQVCFLYVCDFRLFFVLLKGVGFLCCCVYCVTLGGGAPCVLFCQ